MAFAKRFQSDGNESAINPTSEVDLDLPEEVVADKVFLGRFDPDGKHSQEVLDEDDAWQAMAAPELWEYDVVDGREQDFISALQNAETVMEFSIVDETTIAPEDLTSSSPLDESAAEEVDTFDLAEERQAGGSIGQSVGDGPAGLPTADPTAGGMGRAKALTSNEEAQEIGDEASGGTGDLNIVSAEDPSLGLTNYRDRGPDDWAADTGPTSNPDYRG